MKHPNMTIFFRKILAVALCLGLLFSGLKLTTTLSAAEEMPEYDGPEAYVYVEGVTIQNAVSETQTVAETIIVDEDILELRAIVAPDNADETTVIWNVSQDSDYIKLYKTDDCVDELDPEEDEIESGTAVYVKGFAAGEATITVTTVGVDAENEEYKTATCKVTVIEPEPEPEPEPEVILVEGVAIRKDEIDTEAETIYTDEILALNAAVDPDTAYNTNVLWSVTSGDDKSNSIKMKAVRRS